MPSAWITHVKQFASQNHMKYGNALKHPQCKASYHKLKGGMIPRIPDGPRPSNQAPGRREQMSSSPVQTVGEWIPPPEEAEVIPITNVQDEAVDVIQQIQSVQEMIQQFTHDLSVNPNRSRTINILRAFQQTESTLFDQASYLTSVLNADDYDLPVANRTRTSYVPYNHHIRDENWFRENPGSDYNLIGPDDQQYFLLHNYKTGSGIRRQRRRK